MSKRIKTELQEDQDDLLLSYLNSECMATNTLPCWANSHMDQKYIDTVSDSLKEPNHPWSYLAPSSPNHLLTDMSLFWAQQQQQNHQDTLYHQLACSPSYFQATESLEGTPPSPSSLSSYSSSSSDTKPRKKRGRKKRATLTHPTLLQPYPPVVIAPAPLKPLTPILPALELNKAEEKTEKEQENAEHPIDTKQADPQKAAIIAKRQERLIKNRAAALLSRKRKREHLIALEDQRKELLDTNKSLNEQIRQLQLENLKLHTLMNPNSSQEKQTEEDGFICIMMAMILLFYCTFVASFSQIKSKKEKLI
ncbi:hypothetical protein BD560DRAFT_149284 [Blakeslea trispora]|nr:hypothetical protein BD560DRAFT_149284 [Blakeslea trispora]